MYMYMYSSLTHWLFREEGVYLLCHSKVRNNSLSLALFWLQICGHCYVAWVQEYGYLCLNSKIILCTSTSTTLRYETKKPHVCLCVNSDTCTCKFDF